MDDVLNNLTSWINIPKPFVLATVIQTWGSAPRGVGSMMIIRGDMQVSGSVSGGCVENEVIEEAIKVIKTGNSNLLEFGVKDETAWSVGLSCGGRIKIFVERVSTDIQNIWRELVRGQQKNQPCILIKNISPKTVSERSRLLFPEQNNNAVQKIPGSIQEHALLFYHQRKSGLSEIDGENIFFQIFPRKDKLIIIGAAHISIPLVKLARELEFEIIVIDPRRIFSNEERFPIKPDEIFTKWPGEALMGMGLNEDTYCVLLTHDPKIDDEALKILLKSKVSYIGALGSKKSHAKRCLRLSEAGFSDTEISRIYGPVGLDIGAESPQEIALSIMAQIVEIKNNKLSLETDKS